MCDIKFKVKSKNKGWIYVAEQGRCISDDFEFQLTARVDVKSLKLKYDTWMTARTLGDLENLFPRRWLWHYAPQYPDLLDILKRENVVSGIAQCSLATIKLAQNPEKLSFWLPFGCTLTNYPWLDNATITGYSLDSVKFQLRYPGKRWSFVSVRILVYTNRI